MRFGSKACAALVVLTLTGCASPTDCCAPPATAADSAAAQSDTERLAAALVDADAAFARGDKVRLAHALRRFDALGGKPLDATTTDLDMWRAAIDQPPPMRGRSLGPGYRSGQLSAGRSEQLEQVFLSGKRASVALSAPSGARLKLEIVDRSQEAVCGKEGNSSHCQWVPLFTDRYQIRIINPGEKAVRYFLVVG
jgi:hypothetical protein